MKTNNWLVCSAILIILFLLSCQSEVIENEDRVIIDIDSMEEVFPQTSGINIYKTCTKGEEFTIWLQLKTIADIGIIGLPNAGKSSLLAAITNANPKIANYKFTTLNPNLGVASYDDKEVVLADIPGLVEGAHEGVGLGIQFLKHIERCKSLLHLIDITNIDLNESYDQVKNELKSYSSKLLDKKELIVLNKIDLIDEGTAKEIIDHFSKNKKCEILTMTTLKKSSISKIKAKLLSYVS
jgi:GTP-binding protein